MGKGTIAAFAVLLASLVLLAGCVGKSANSQASGGSLQSDVASVSGTGSHGGISQDDFSSLESELAGLEGNDSFFVADEFESDILG